MGLLTWWKGQGRGASAEDRSPWGDFWFEPQNATAATGQRIGADQALRLSAVYACVRILAETFAMLPLVVYRVQSSGGRQVVRDHWLYRLLARRPNPYQNAFEWREMMQGHLALRGNAFNEMILAGDGTVEQLVPLHPDRVKIEMLAGSDYRYRITDATGEARSLARGQVWHIKGLSTDGYMGMSPLSLARDVVALGTAAQEYGARFFQNDAKPSGWIESPQGFKDDAARASFRESWKAVHGGRNRGSVAVLDRGMKFHELGLTNKDSQFLEARQFQISEIARIFRVPPHKIGDLSRATFSNIEHQSLEFVQDTMTPWAERWEASIESDLLLDSDRVEVEFEFSNLLRGDQAARSAYYASGITNGWLTRNEVRLRENLEPLDGLDEPLQPLNMVSVDEAERAADQRVPDVLSAPQDAPAEEEAGTDARLAVIVQSNAERLARRATKVFASGKTDAGLATAIAEALAVDVQAAEHWCSRERVDITERAVCAELVALATGGSS